jgi:hypothetical protein
LYQTTDACTVAKGFTRVCKRTQIRVIDALLDQVLCNSRSGFLCTLNASRGTCADKAVYDGASSRLTKDLDELDRQEFKCADRRAQQRGSATLFLSSAPSASAFRSLTGASADSESGGQKLTAGKQGG